MGGKCREVTCCRLQNPKSWVTNKPRCGGVQGSSSVIFRGVMKRSQLSVPNAGQLIKTNHSCPTPEIACLGTKLAAMASTALATEYYESSKLAKYPFEPYWPEQKLRICVTGAGGFIASHLAKRLKTEGHYLVCADWKRNSFMPVRRPVPKKVYKLSVNSVFYGDLCAAFLSCRCYVSIVFCSIEALLYWGIGGLLVWTLEDG